METTTERGTFGGMWGGNAAQGFFGFGIDGRGPAPKDMPGSERFDPNYKGPKPEGRSGFPFGGRLSGFADMGGFGGFCLDGRGPAPKDIPGAERFAPNYDGPVPDRGEYPFGPCQKKNEKTNDNTNKDSSNK